MNREAIYTALLALVTPTAPFVSISRVWRPHTDYTTPQMPALLFDELPEKFAVPVQGGHPVVTLPVDIWLYFVAPQVSQMPGLETIIPQAALNGALDTLTAAFQPDYQGTYPALGGLIQWARIEGTVQKVAGVASGNAQYSIAKVPIVMRYVDPA